MTSETQGILHKISALRQRLEQARSQAQDASESAVASLTEHEAPGLARLWELEHKTSTETDHRRQLDVVVKPVVHTERAMPSQLTGRARRAIEKGRGLIHALREYQAEPLVREPGAVLTMLYREATSLAEAALRLVAGLPDSPSAQLQMCDSVESLLDSASQRLGSLGLALRRQREEQAQIDRLGDFLDRLDLGAPADLNAMTDLAETLIAEAGESMPLRFIQPASPVAERGWVVRLVAGHSLTVAQVMARLARQEPEFRGRVVECVQAALLHDTGMLRVPPEVLSRIEPLDDARRRTIESHCRVGGHLMARYFPNSQWLAETAAQHHERLDGTGYPDGMKADQLSPLVRLLAVCDVYAAACQVRPHRPARETRTALTDTLLLAEKGQFDRHFAERLLQLSFYPAGSVVELADGSLAGVVAAPAGRHDLHAPSRPVVVLLTDGQGRMLPSPRYLDLSQGDSHSIVRALGAEERRRTLGARYPEWVL
jgi:HD-GYP domain-containing protein (c-di-GMP phosphodiesterase class II)